MIHEFELWSAPRIDTNHLSDLSGAVLAIEADFYLGRLLNNSPAKEPLLSALGGLPFSFQKHIQAELDVLHKNGVKPVFVFSGLDVGKRYSPFALGDAVASLNTVAWDLYNRHEAQDAVENFGNSGYATPRRYYRLFQKVLRDANVEFHVAPYSAFGQLAYLSRHAPEHVNAIAGSSELLLFDIDRVITGFEFPDDVFTFVRRQQCFEELGGIPSDTFTDACMLSGCSLLPPIPLPQRGRVPVPKVRHVLELMKTNGSTGYSVCTAFQDQPDMRELDYMDRYKRGRLAIKHDVILTITGKVEPLAPEDAPSDLHELIGQRLPDELYYYLSVGAIGPRVLNHLTSAHIHEQCPADGGESEAYRVLIADKLNASRMTTLALLAWYLARVYQHRTVELLTWYAPDRPISLNLNDAPDQRPLAHQWKVPAGVFLPSAKFEAASGSLFHAVRQIAEAGSGTRGHKSRLRSTSELKANSILRFLHLRGYVDNQHELTAWGKVLSMMMTELSESSEQHEAAVLACELLKFDLLSSETMFPSYTGAPMHGSETDKSNTLLLARVACLGKLHHNQIGFTGPLSRHLLGYGALVDAVRTSLRDLLEVCLVSVLLSGDAIKDRKDLTDVGLDLPFLLPNDIALGIAMKHYLDDVSLGASSAGGVTQEICDQAKTRGPNELFPHVADFKGDLDNGFKLWDAVSTSYPEEL